MSIGSTINTGSHFTDSQTKGEGFSKVAAAWTEQCQSYDEGMEKLVIAQEQIQDLRTPLKEWEPGVSAAGKLVITHKPSLREFVPTSKAIKDMAVLGKTSQWVIDDMLTDKGEAADAEVIVKLLNRTLFNPDRTDLDKIRLIRTWKDGSLRTILSDRYAIINNCWVLEQMRKLIPGGLLSHWRGDADTIFGNVLMPDTVRGENADKFGAMVSVGNSEIGLRRIYTQPSAFRAICMNGCIWNQEKGDALNRKHVGEINLDQLAADIATNVHNQVPLIPGIIDAVLGTRQFKFPKNAVIRTIAVLFDEIGLNKSNSVGYFDALKKEGECGTEQDSLFYLMQGITRYSQTLPPDQWVDLDRAAGELSRFNSAKWDKFLKKVEATDDKEVAKKLGDIAHLA